MNDSNERLGYSITLAVVIAGLAYAGFRSNALTTWKFTLLLALMVPYWWAFRPYSPISTPRLIVEGGILIRLALSLVLVAALVGLTPVGTVTAIGVALILWVGPRLIAPVVAMLSASFAMFSVFFVPLFIIVVLALIVGVAFRLLR